MITISTEAEQGMQLIIKHLNIGQIPISDFIEALGTGSFIVKQLPVEFLLSSTDEREKILECYNAGREDKQEKRPYNFELIFGENQPLINIIAYRLGYLEID